MTVSIISFSDMGEKLALRINEYFSLRGDAADAYRCESGALSKWTSERFNNSSALIFIGSCGIAARAIAPHIVNKLQDPAVVVIDETGTYCVSMLSGHIGGANLLTKQLANFLCSIPVITTATDRRNIFAIDDYAAQNGLFIANPERIKWVSSKLLSGETAFIKSAFPIRGALPDGITEKNKGYDILVSWRTRGRAEALKLVPRVICLGIGARKNISEKALEEAYRLMLKKASCHPAAIKKVCSIDIKRNEPGILAFCQKHGFPFFTYTAKELNSLGGIYTASAFVKQVTGVDNVCERSAVYGCGEGGRLISGKEAGGGVTMALAISPYTLKFEENANE